mmetsp:Transcript_29139/g.65959  ORF Transcript_29139/g.65959 Transcript_29139/m.65959 type:complete len:221 (-) Transcript_29139:307-969(-)
MERLVSAAPAKNCGDGVKSRKAVEMPAVTKTEAPKQKFLTILSSRRIRTEMSMPFTASVRSARASTPVLEGNGGRVTGRTQRATPPSSRVWVAMCTWVAKVESSALAEPFRTFSVNTLPQAESEEFRTIRAMPKVDGAAVRAALASWCPLCHCPRVTPTVSRRSETHWPVAMRLERNAQELKAVKRIFRLATSWKTGGCSSLAARTVSTFITRKMVAGAA